MHELGFLPVDKTGADPLFQIISGRYERGSTIVTSNRVYNLSARSVQLQPLRPLGWGPSDTARALRYRSLTHDRGLL